MQFRPHRYRTEYPITFRTPVSAVKAIINDVNETGALVTIDTPLDRGQIISMSFVNNTVEAMVQWSRQGRCGIAFRPMLTLAQVDLLRYKAGSHHANMRHNSSGYAEMS